MPRKNNILLLQQLNCKVMLTTRLCCITLRIAGFSVQFPGGKAAVCEGELKSFGAKFIKGKGKKVAVFKKGGCLGTSSLIGLNTSDEESAQGLQWPASLPQVRPLPIRDISLNLFCVSACGATRGMWVGLQIVQNHKVAVSAPAALLEHPSVQLQGLLLVPSCMCCCL